MTALNVVQFPEHHAPLDIPSALRALADEVEAGEHGASLSLLWGIDAGDGDINLGLMGKVMDPGFAAYFLAGAAQKVIMSGVGE